MYMNDKKNGFDDEVWVIFAPKSVYFSPKALKGLHLSLDQGVKGERMVPNFGGGVTKTLRCSPERDLGARVGISVFSRLL